MKYVICIVDGVNIYWMHNKLYDNEKQAKNALKVMIENGKVSTKAKVYGVGNWDLRRLSK
jgi:fructose 1,6-bisphosphatase